MIFKTHLSDLYVYSYLLNYGLSKKLSFNFQNVISPEQINKNKKYHMHEKQILKIYMTYISNFNLNEFFMRYE